MWASGLTVGAIMAVVLSAWILVTLRFDSQLWRSSYPMEAQAAAHPRSEAAARCAKLVALPFLLALFGGPIVAAWLAQDQGFWAMAGAAWIASTCFNLADTIVVDLLVGVLWDPQFARLPGTEDGPSYQTVDFHVRAFGVGLATATLLSPLHAGFAWLIGP